MFVSAGGWGCTFGVHASRELALGCRVDVVNVLSGEGCLLDSTSTFGEGLRAGRLLIDLIKKRLQGTVATVKVTGVIYPLALVELPLQ